MVIDGAIDTPDLWKAGELALAEPLLDPHSMAETYWSLVTQEKSAWTLEFDLRPFNEDFFV